MLVGVGAADPLTFGASALFLLAVSLLASYWPARRAVAVDPMTAIRGQ
jgi:putative ABC transport system permease protein